MGGILGSFAIPIPELSHIEIWQSRINRAAPISGTVRNCLPLGNAFSMRILEMSAQTPWTFGSTNIIVIVRADLPRP